MPGMVEIAPLPPVPLHDLFTYRVPDGLAGRVVPGVRVRVPLGRQTRTGVVTGFAETAPPGELRAVLDVLEPTPFVPADLLELCRWTARYYLVSLAEVIATVVPTRLPAPPAERALRLVCTLAPEELAGLARRAPARARAYELLRDAPASTLTLAAARSAGLGAGVLRALRTAGLAEAIRVEPARPALRRLSAQPSDAPSTPSSPPSPPTPPPRSSSTASREAARPKCSSPPPRPRSHAAAACSCSCRRSRSRTRRSSASGPASASAWRSSTARSPRAS